MTIRKTAHTPQTLALMHEMGDETQQLLGDLMREHAPHVPHAESAIMEGTLFGFCAMAFDLKPADMTADDLTRLITEQVAKYVASFEAENIIGRAQGSA